MKRILVVDDERPVIETISLIVKRELAGEFEVAGYAMTGRDAIEKAASLSPDIILMDVRMPGIPGLDAIREIRKRGSAAAFILVTAYERFDIAREAVELGVIDYLLKPVSKDKLALALRSAADSIERRGEADRREIEHREREETMRGFVETAFLHGIMLGDHFGGDVAKYRSVLGITEPFAVVAAVLFLPSPGALKPEEEAHALHDGFRATIRYKTKAFAGPLVAGHAVVLLPVPDAASSVEAVESLRRVILQAHGPEFEKGHLRMGFGTPRPMVDAGFSWSEALRSSLGSCVPADGGPVGERLFENDDTFLECLVNGSPERARLALERLLDPLRSLGDVPISDRYRIIALFGSAGRLLAKRGLLTCEDALGMMDCEDLRVAGSGLAFDLIVRARFSALVGVIGRAPQWSPLVSRAIAFVQGNYGKPMSLETTAYTLGISPNRLSRLFSEETGKGFSDYLIEYRIEKAKEMLVQPGASIKQVSISCGYPDPNYFSRLFKKVTGLTPTTFSCGTTEASDGNA
jgi:two-component system, response regulator YesN